MRLLIIDYMIDIHHDQKRMEGFEEAIFGNTHEASQ
jgi:hypothetical protein